MAVAAVKNGAWDFLEKPFHDNELVDRVAQVLAAASVAQSSDAEAQRLRQALVSLSPREREVLDELIRGHYNKNIADHLGITPRTVEFHRANIFEKMGVGSAIELAHKPVSYTHLDVYKRQLHISILSKKRIGVMSNDPRQVS